MSSNTRPDGLSCFLFAFQVCLGDSSEERILGFLAQFTACEEGSVALQQFIHLKGGSITELASDGLDVFNLLDALLGVGHFIICQIVIRNIQCYRQLSHSRRTGDCPRRFIGCDGALGNAHLVSELLLG